MALELNNSTGICSPECPAFRALDQRAEEVLSSGLCEGEKNSYMEDVALSAVFLDRAAGIVACRSQIKELPDMSETVPKIGDTARVDFVRQCPAYNTYKQLQAAGRN